MNAKIVLGVLLILFLVSLDAHEFMRRARHWTVIRRAHDWFATFLGLCVAAGFVAAVRPPAGTAFLMPGMYFLVYAFIAAYEWMGEIWSFTVHEAPRDRLDEMNHVVRQRLLPTEEAQIEDEDLGLPRLRIRRVDRKKARLIVADLKAYLEENRTVPRFRVVSTLLSQGVVVGLVAFVVVEMLR